MDAPTPLLLAVYDICSFDTDSIWLDFFFWRRLFAARDMPLELVIVMALPLFPSVADDPQLTLLEAISVLSATTPIGCEP